MDMYKCTCIVWDYITDYEEPIHNTYDITRYIEARDEYQAEEKLIAWVHSIWADADIDNIIIY